MESYTRPNRSDVHLSKEEEAKIEESTRHHFHEIAPKRHTKPQRSEYSAAYSDALTNANDEGPIPEFVEFQRLETGTQKVMTNGSQVPEEFTETEYYKDLNCVDKQHHTTGSGFIKVGDTNDTAFSLTPDSAADHHASSKGNPATNEWIPAPANTGDFLSDKPNRSDS